MLKYVEYTMELLKLPNCLKLNISQYYNNSRLSETTQNYVVYNIL